MFQRIGIATVLNLLLQVFGKVRHHIFFYLYLVLYDWFSQWYLHIQIEIKFPWQWR